MGAGLLGSVARLAWAALLVGLVLRKLGMWLLDLGGIPEAM